jgi:hypothetical protein
MPNRALVYLACGALTVGPTVGAFAATGSPAAPASPATTTTAPPPAHAEGAALEIKDLLGIGHTTADAGNGSSSAKANALEVGGKPLIDGTTGGTQSGNGTSQGALLDTGATPLGRLQLTPWQASAASGNGTSSADAEAALARAYLVDPTVLNVAILQSSSHAKYDSTGSTGSASSDGAVVDLGNGALNVDLLHAESSSDGKGGTSYLASVNGNEIGTSDQANGQCTVTVPQVVSLSCLTASGGPASTTASSAVGTATVGAGQGSGEIVGTGTQGGKVAASAANGNSGADGQSDDHTRVLGEKIPQTGASLPFTGSEVAPLAALAALAVAAGAWLQQLGRRRRSSARA